MKRFKHFLVTIAMLLCSLAVNAYDFEVGGIYYNITSEEDLTVSVTYKGTYGWEYPNEYSGVVIIPESVIYNSDTYSVTSIGSSAFDECSSLAAITLPESVTSIGNYAFEYCSSLTSITIPKSVTSIGRDTFNGCENLTAVHISSIDAWYNITFHDNPLSYAHNLYLNGILVTELVIPESVTSIGDRAFSGCESLVKITIPESVTSIGSSAFDECSSLAAITFPENSQLTSIGNYAFRDCSSLTSITIPEGVTSIGGYAFDNCTSLTSISIPENSQLTSIGNYAFGDCSSLTSITIPEGVTSIGGSAFSDCSNLTSITIPEGVTSIGERAFYGCSSLTTITIPEGVTSIGNDAFYYCSSLTSISIPEGVTSIGEGAFRDCSSLTSITIPEGVTSIGNYAFRDCSSLTSITIPEGVPSIGDKAFSYCLSLTSITIPASVTSIGYNAFEVCYNLAKVDVHIASVESWITNNFASSLGCSYSLYLDDALLTSVDIPSSVTSIPNNAFYNCKNITSVNIPEGVTMIGENAFQNCSALTIAVLPKSLSMIKKNAFYGCSLKSIVIPENVEFIYSEAFANCRALESVKVLAIEPPFAYDKTFSDYGIELCVPEEAMEAYRTTAPWSNFTNIRNLEGEEVEVKQCASPTIDYIDGQVVLTCETEEVTFKSSIKVDDARSYDEAAYTLAATYTITAYATKEDYLDSETTTVTLCWVACGEHTNDGDETKIEIPSLPVLIKTDGGVITLTGLTDGAAVAVYDIAGVGYGTAVAENGEATIATTLEEGSTAIVKIGERSVRVLVK